MSRSEDQNNNTFSAAEPESGAAKCPFPHGKTNKVAGGGTRNSDWWPAQLRVDLLNQHSSRSNPLGEDFDYRREFASLDYYAL